MLITPEGEGEICVFKVQQPMLDAAHRRWKSSISYKWPQSSKGQPCRKSSTTLATQISVQSTHCEISAVHWSYCAHYVPIAMIKLSKCFNLLDMHSTVCACAVAICLGFWEPRKLTGLPGIQNPRLRVTFWFFHLDRIFGWKKEMHLWSSRNKWACPTEKEEAFAREKKKFAGRDKTTLKLETGNSRMDAPPLQASVYYTNPKWEWEALEKTKYSEAYESTGTTYKKRWVKSAAVSPKEFWVIDKSASIPQHPACPNPYLSLMHAYVCILSIMVRIGKTCQSTYVMDLFERAAEGNMLGSGTQCNPERGKHTQTWMTPHTSHRQVRLLQGTGWPLTFKLWPL